MTDTDRVALAYDAVLLAGFGGPEGQDDVIPFLRNVTRGRGIPEARLEIVGGHYRAFGGISPVNAQNRALRAALEAELAARGLPVLVYWGNRNWAPYLADAVTAAHDAGHTRLLALTTSAYSSYSSCRQYREDFATALTEAGLEGAVRIDAVRPYFDHPGFVTPFVAGVNAALARFAAAEIAVADTHVLFTTHSIPQADADRSGPLDGGFGAGGAYVAQHLAVAKAVMAALAGPTSAPDPAPSSGSVVLSESTTPGCSLAFQSRSGPPGMPWLEPDVNDRIAELAASGIRAVVLVPVGFVSDHMEVRWDLDTEAAATAAALGVALDRVPTPGLDPAFIAGLADLVTERLELEPAIASAPTSATAPTPVPAQRCRLALTALGPWPDSCPPGCCAKAPATHGQRAHAAG
jgi:protoporphyrin/coproporphyrin ferrochelatase